MKKFPVYKKGFTLMESLVVIAIIAILAGIIIVGFKQLQPEFQLSGAVRGLLSDLRYVQQLAITEQVNYCLKLFLAEKKYQIIQCGQSQPLYQVIFSSQIKSFSAFGFTNNEIKFNPYGSVKESGTITLENTEGKTKTIEVKPSGFVK